MNAIQIGSRREVCWDFYLADTSKTTASLQLHQPKIGEIVLTHSLPWEGDGCDYYSIVEEEDRYRLYYLAWEMLNENQTAHYTCPIKICYAESKDGIHWEKPSLGLLPFEGNWENNILLDETIAHYDSFFVFKDTNPDCPAEERYKGTALHNDDHCLWCYTSGDGLHFKKAWKISSKGKFDTQNVALWDPERQEYICYIRDFHDIPTLDIETLRAQGYQISERAGDLLNLGIRDIRYITSKDFREWSDPVLLDFGSKEDYALYTNAVQRYPRAPQMLFGLPSRYVERRQWNANFDQLAGAELRKKRAAIHPRYGLTTTDCVLMTSRDGRSWGRWDEPLMTPGIERNNNWVYGDCYPAVGLIETPSSLRYAPSEYSLYCPENHWTGQPTELRRYTIRMDGFVSYHAPYAGARVVTRPLIFDGDHLEINFATSARGAIYIKLTCEGECISSCELFGDSLSREVPFDGDISKFSGKEVVMELEMSDADLYSFRFYRKA